MEALGPHWIGVAVALGCGLLIGVERERRKGAGGARAAAGVRSFTIAAVAGALAQGLGQPLLVAAGALLVLLLAAVSHWKSRSRDPGVTTELALFVTYLLGVTAAVEPALAGAGAVVVTVLLAARSSLHRLSTRVIQRSELRDGLILAGAALVVLPLVPDRPLAWLAGVNPRTLWSLVVALLSLQALGYVAMRWLGPQRGLALSGFASGFVSSTATHGAMGARARSRPELARACAGGALASNVATIAQLAVVAAAASPAVLRTLWPVLLAGAVVAAAAAALAASGAPRGQGGVPVLDRLFDLRGSLVFAAVLSGVTAVATLVGDRFGASAAMAGTALAGFVDVHASLASVCTMVEAGRLAAQDSGLPVLLGFSANTASKLLAAWVSGGAGFALRVVPGLLALLAAVWGSWLALG
jgi:uncharacterized membrane protein (DUF4010 family)